MPFQECLAPDFWLVEMVGDLQNIQEEGNYSCIDQVGEHGADDGNNEEGLDGITVLVAYSTHVGHRIGSRTKAEATDACTQDGSIVTAT